MSRLGSKLSKRIMAAALSVAMIMSNMTVYATQVSDDPIPAEEIAVDEDLEILDEAAEVVANVEENTQDADDVDELTYTEVESAETLYSVDSAEINANAEGGIGTYGLKAEKKYEFDKNKGAALTALNETFKEDDIPADFEFQEGAFPTAIDSSGHGLKTEADNAELSFTTPGETTETVDITVVLCCYNAALTGKVTCDAADKIATELKIEDAQKGLYAPTYTVLGVSGGTKVTLKISNNTYIHSISTAVRGSGVEYGTITVDNSADTNGNKVYVSPAYAAAGETITLTAVPTSGYSVKSWGVMNGEDEVAATPAADGLSATFAMPSPAADLTVTPEFEQKGTLQNIEVDTGTIHGTVTAKKEGEEAKAISGSAVVVSDYASVEAESGYHFKAWKVTDASGTTVPVTRNNKGQYVFDMPESTTTISAEFEEDNTELRKVWVFQGTGADANDISIWGMDNTEEYVINVAENGTPVTVAGLKIVKGLFSTKGRLTNHVEVNADTVIEVPVAGPCKVAVKTYQDKGCTIDGTVATTDAPVNCKGTDGKVTIAMNADTRYITSIKVEPVTTYTITVADASAVTHVTAIKSAANAPETAAEGAPVTISDLVNEVVLDDAETYEVTGWTITYTEDSTSKTEPVTKGQDGEYTFTMPAANVTVTPVVTEKGALPTSWNFNDGEFVKDSVVLSAGYNGLVFSTSNAGKNTGGDGTTYLTLNENGTVQIPIDATKNWAVKVGYSYAANAKFEDEETASIYIETTGGSGTAVYYHEANADLKNPGYVTVTGLAGYENKPTYITNIQVVQVAKGNINVTTTVDKATVSTTGKITYALEGQTVKLNDVAEVTIATEYAETYEVSGWSVKYGQTDVKVNKDTDGYNFVMPAGDVTVTPLVTEKAVQDPYPEWNFSNADFQDGSYAPEKNTNGYDYNGLLISASTNAGSYNKKYLQIKNGDSVSIPVQGPRTITVTTQFNRSFYFELEGTEKVQAGGSGDGNDFNYSYDYTGNAGYVVIKATNTTYFTKIVVSALAQKYAVTVANDEHATVNKVENAPTEFTEGRPVKLNDLVTSVEAASGYEHNGWAVTTVNGEKVDVNYSETDGYTFTMPSEAVTVKPIINPVAQERTVTVAFKAGEETLEATDLTDTVIIFEDTVNLTNTLEVIVGKAGTDLNAIKLKDGTYKVTVYNSKLYVVQPDEFTVSENSLTCTINFDKNPKSWNFNDEVFKKYYGTNTGFGWYNGLELTSVVTNGNKYSKLENGSKIKVPVSGECNVTVTYYGGAGWLGATVGNKPYVAASGDGSVTYHYQGPDAGVVEIAASGQASVWTIDITDPVAAPVFEPTTANESEYTFETKAGDVSITSSDSEAVVKYVVSTDYTDNAAAFEAITEDSILAAGDDKLRETQPFRVSVDGTVIKAVAVKGGITSKLVSYTYNVTETGKDPVDAPVATPAGGTVEVGTEVTLEAADGAEIYYTLNNLTPTTSSQKYDKENNPIKLTAEGEITLKAIAVKDDVTSAMITCKYNVVKITKLNSVSISGRAKPGETLTANLSFTGTPGSNTSIRYDWFKVTENADGSEKDELLQESSNTYTIPDEGFVDAKICVMVTFTDELGGTQTAEYTTNAIKASAIEGNGLEIEFDDGKEYTYTGTAIKPAIIVTNNGKELVEGTDYTVKYTNNVKAGKASGDAYDKKAPGVTVTGKGNLSGKISANFTINPQSLEEVKAGDVVVVEGAKATLVLLYNGVKLTAKDYEVTAPTDFKTHKWAKADEGEDKITIKGKGNFSDAADDAISLDVKVITKEESKNAKIKANFADTAAVKKLTYTGEDIKPVMAVSNKANDADLAEGIDFIVSYPDDVINVGTKKVTVVGTSSRCTGSVTKSYTIKPAKGGTLTVEGVEESYPFVSTGVTFGEEVKVYYTYTDESNVEQKSDPLTEGVDYKITYTGNKKAGTAKYAVTGLGNYKGLKIAKTDFTITGLALTDDDDNMDVIVSDKLYTKAAVYKSVPVVIANGTVVKASEYKVEYQIDGEDGWTAKPAKIDLGAEETKKTINVKITAKKATGNYGAAVDEGKELKGSYDVVRSEKADFGKAKITFFNKDGSKAAKVGFTGKEVTPYKAVIKCKNVEDVEIILDEKDENFATNGYEAKGFDVTYAGNVLKGKATVVISATDANEKYVGSKSATFNIVQKNLQKDLDLAAGEGFKAQSITAFFKDLFK